MLCSRKLKRESACRRVGVARARDETRLDETRDNVNTVQSVLTKYITVLTLHLYNTIYISNGDDLSIAFLSRVYSRQCSMSNLTSPRPSENSSSQSQPQPQNSLGSAEWNDKGLSWILMS